VAAPAGSNRRLLSLWDEPQTAALEPYAPPEILAADLSRWCSSSRHWGSAIRQSSFSRPAAGAGAQRSPHSFGRPRRHRRAPAASRRKAGSLNRLPLPPRLARMVVDASWEGAGSLAAEIAAVLTERGLGGNDVDLRHRLEALRRDRSARAGEARRMAERWAEMASSPTSAS